VTRIAGELAGTRRSICFVAVAAQRGIGGHEGKWFAAVLTPKIKGVIAF
jgi:hypothetical protein